MRHTGSSRSNPSAVSSAWTIEILEPDRATEQLQQGIVANCTRPQAACEGEVESVADPTTLPFLTPHGIRIERQTSFFDPTPTTTTVLARADEQVALKLHDAELLASRMHADHHWSAALLGWLLDV
jgi:hypothetical protein